MVSEVPVSKYSKYNPAKNSWELPDIPDDATKGTYYMSHSQLEAVSGGSVSIFEMDLGTYLHVFVVRAVGVDFKKDILYRVLEYKGYAGRLHSDLDSSWRDILVMEVVGDSKQEDVFMLRGDRMWTPEVVGKTTMSNFGTEYWYARYI